MASPPNVLRFPPGVEIDDDLAPDAAARRTQAEMALDRLDWLLASARARVAASSGAGAAFRPMQAIDPPRRAVASFASTSPQTLGAGSERRSEGGPPLGDGAVAERRPTVARRAAVLRKVSRGALLTAIAVAAFLALGVGS